MAMFVAKPPFPIPNILRLAKVSTVSFTDMLRECDECAPEYDISLLQYADVKIDFGNGEVTYKCFEHLKECEARLNV